jgi:hypothetical protein
MKQRTRKHGADESTELFRAATKAGGKSPKINKKVNKLAEAFREDDPTRDSQAKSKNAVTFVIGLLQALRTCLPQNAPRRWAVGSHDWSSV